ncbi:MAG: pyridoxal phosphate-dependent aminotransferase [Spirochaetes bacterium]|nr:pyridoxal phosphate-dependent aminotransferase [Spirochaetota bacterium]
MNFSERILKVKPSPTLAITALANSLKAKGVDVIGFGSGEPDFDTPDFIKDAAVRALNAGKTKYTPAGGIVELKEAIAKKFKKDNNLSYETSNVTVNCGGKHSFYNLMQIFLNDGDEVIIPAPYWVSYPSIVLLAGGNPVILNSREENNFKVTPDEIKAVISNKTKAIVINSPSNPTGSMYNKKELKAIADVLAEYDIAIISDDIYESLIYDNNTFTNIANISDEIKNKTIVLNGVSKTYSMTGWRIGYMAASQDIIKKVEIIQSQSTSNPTSIAQWAALEALSGDQSIIQKMLEVFDRRRKIIIDGLNAIEGITCNKPDGAFYAFPNITGVLKHKGWDSVKAKYQDVNNSSALCSYLIQEAGVAAVPGVEFGSDSHLRLSFATSDENIIKGVDRIKSAVEKMI